MQGAGMFIKLTRSGPRRYVQLAESYRDENGRVKQRTIASLGRVEQIERSIDSIVRGLHRVAGRPEPVTPPLVAAEQNKPEIQYEPARALGDAWTLTSLWKELGFDSLSRVFGRSSRRRIAVEQLIRVMVFNRLCDPESKLGVLRWLERAVVPGIDTAAITHQHLLRAMDALIDEREAVDEVIASLLRPLIDVELSIVFYDLTTIRAEGLSEQKNDVRRFGKSKDGGIRRQFVIGVVQSADGLPIHHEVFDGNVAEVSTLSGTLERVMARFPIKRVIAIADRGLMSSDNLDVLEAIKTPSGKPLEYILAVPGRRYVDFVDVLAPLQKAHFAACEEEVFAETKWAGRRLVVAHDPVRAGEQKSKRDTAIAALEEQAAEWVGKLVGQDDGKRSRGRPLSDGGVRARFYHAVLEARLGRIIRVDLKSELFTYTLDAKAQRLAELMDGKLLVVTNVGKKDFDARSIIGRYKSLADIERGFRVLKSELEIGPVHHRLAERIRAHASVCFIALILHRVMRQKLRAVESGVSPERALETLARIQHHRVRLDEQEHSGVTTTSAEQQALLAALGASVPTTTKQLSLL